MRPPGVTVNPTGWSSSATVTTRTDGAALALDGPAAALPANAATRTTTATTLLRATDSRRICPSVVMVTQLPSCPFEPFLVDSPSWEHGSVTTVPPSMFGVPALRSEDPRFLTGHGRYLENLPIEGAARAVFVRSIMPHARVVAVHADRARALPGVVGVFTAADFDLAPLPPSGNVEGAEGVLEGPFGREVLARDVVRFVGEPLALVVAESLAQAEDAAEAVLVELDPLPAVTDVEAAIAEEAPLLWPGHGSNVASTFSTDWDDDVLEGADGRRVRDHAASA